MDNWAQYVYGEIQISRENEEKKAVKELEIQLLENIKGARKEYEIVIKRFIETGKNITSTNALLISNLVESHPYYVQQLAQQAWLRTKKSCTEM